MSGLNVYVPGLGSSHEGSSPFCAALERATGRPTIGIDSERFGEPHTPDTSEYPDALERQARHIRDILDGVRYNGKLYIYTHSMGTPIGLIFAKAYRGGHQLDRVVPIAPANLWAESFPRVGARIARKVAADLRTDAGRTYWLNALTHYFVNPFRSLEEGWEVSEEAVAGGLMQDLQRQGTPLLVAVSPDDDVFPARLVREALDRLGIRHFDLSRGSKHSPDFRPDRLIADLRRNGAL